ncbi:MAG: 5-formyltetrahydrofolate cyclo-ligase [Moraxellaceae bacterium]|nr:5-formyltetrahydrofolate cyclo-ligase [Moraxellaceae bacterium]
MPSFSSSEKSLLRRELRARRRALSLFDQRRAARALAQTLVRLPQLKVARHVALYWPNDGEIDPRALLRMRALSRCRFYLPVLQSFPSSTLGFAPWRGERRLVRNRFGIPEPHASRLQPVQKMDVVLLPLTGFDAAGNRLGMGGGFYDRTLAFLRRCPRPSPRLIGVAHACQQAPALPAENWDVRLQLIVTDRDVISSR